MVAKLTPFEALEAAIAAAGSQSELARRCGVSTTAVWKWAQSSKRLPAEHVLTVEAATGIPRHVLRPDIYPADLGPSPLWTGVDRGAHRVSFNGCSTLQGRAA
ncbi:transcriptional regulator [Novosphingobium sp.]|uniref:transcriptional regulator n=1 Tax=Novosphingobium sp. TaxID=1874826 RepID=UPI002FDD911E